MGLFLALREAIRGFWRTGMVGFVSVATIGASLLVVGVFSQIAAGSYVLVGQLRERVEIDVYLKEGVHRNRAQALARDIEGLPGVAEVHYLDKDAAAEEFREMFGSGMLEALSRNPLPESLRVRLAPESDLSARAQGVLDVVQNHDAVESVDMGQAWVDRLDLFVRILTGVGVLLGGVLCLACGFAVSNTAKLMVLAQRDAIEIMRLVGATDLTVRMTFLVGGALQGCAGGALAALGLSQVSVWWMVWAPDPALTPLLNPGPWLVVLGTLLGILGSRASLNRVLYALAR